ncbi:MAG: ABC transporter ATP-binding protein [Okeania sp. SIO2G4]|uniref:ABC transporter ATP-binding protein n=1 Tax=unclassified Okeania TaxID=2634635 RepID=UPI0013B69E58|nr:MULTISPECIES: ABC transporter ATP-binding protein [unclassified Okeania]NEP06356.1 ABC transporter ATP-binding protein [Okeania sp. SIO4D6]NEP73266.1 ABC transporter ATP-binding protein [Okeania sp. SIO2G5]NEP94131.1 ABC transporter ATP-binding protein [Okeania sp. SIO2F5]NEQ91961.1 ABC transporter ATP-binding protein [Okeania sp. SIO2G4]
MSNIVLDVRDLKVQFTTEEKLLKAVDGISFAVKRGQTLGIVGESGSGKSVTSLAIMGLLLTKSCQINGEIWFNNSAKNEQNSQPINLLQLPAEQKQEYRGGEIAMIFQEPMSSLNPVYTIGFQLTEAIRFHQNVSPTEARRQVASLLQEVKLLPNDEVLRQKSIEEIAEEGRSGATPRRRQSQGNAHQERNKEEGRRKEEEGIRKEEEGISSGTSEREIMLQVNKKKLAMLDRYPHELSGGQLQRVMIAMAISCNPTLLIADEPTTALDVTVQARILELLRELGQRRGMSVIFISHDLGVMAEVADTIAVMYQGKIVESGEIGQIFTQPQHPYTKGLLACRPPLHGKILRLPTVSDFMEEVTNSNGEIEIREKKITVTAEKQNVDLAKQTTPQTTENSILQVNNLRVGFPVKGMFGQTKRLYMAVNDVSFAVAPGETLGLVGESGCGKSTLARAILQLIPITSGQVFFEGQEITNSHRGRSGIKQLIRRLRRDMQIIFQDPFSSLDPRLTVGAAVMEPMLIHRVGNNSQIRRDRAVYLLERVGLTADSLNRYPYAFSGGQRQRICIARALALNPKLIICDESVSALDVSVQAQVLNLFKELQDEFGLTYIFISHDLSVVKFMSDRIMVMNQGKVEEIGLAEQVYNQPQREYTRQLIASIPTGNLERFKVS